MNVYTIVLYFVDINIEFSLINNYILYLEFIVYSHSL